MLRTPMEQEGLYSTWPRPYGPYSHWPRRPSGGEEIAYYRITVGSWLSGAQDAWFEEMSIHNRTDGTACIEGPLTDQSALFGLLWQIRDLKLPLLSVERADVTWT